MNLSHVCDSTAALDGLKEVELRRIWVDGPPQLLH